MKVSQEVSSYLKNMNYYTDKLMEAVDSQLEADWGKGEEFTHPDSKRFKALNIAKANCVWIKSLLTGTYNAMLAAIEQENKQ